MGTSIGILCQGIPLRAGDPLLGHPLWRFPFLGRHRRCAKRGLGGILTGQYNKEASMQYYPAVKSWVGGGGGYVASGRGVSWPSSLRRFPSPVGERGQRGSVGRYLPLKCCGLLSICAASAWRISPRRGYSCAGRGCVCGVPPSIYGLFVPTHPCGYTEPYQQGNR